MTRPRATLSWIATIGWSSRRGWIVGLDRGPGGTE
jgi:hypothetical protein